MIFFHNALGQRQSQSPSPFLGRETWAEHRLEMILGNAFARVRHLHHHFPAFLERALRENPLKAEYFLPSVVTELLDEGRATVRVLKSRDRWYGVTYKEDKESVTAAFARLTAEGVYPEELWA